MSEKDIDGDLNAKMSGNDPLDTTKAVSKETCQDIPNKVSDQEGHNLAAKQGELTEAIGDIFKIPTGSVIIHACNCQGQWGSGVASAIKTKFPAAYEAHHEYCNTPNTAEHRASLAGTCQLIEPQEEDVKKSGSYYIACVFSSVHYGQRKDKPNTILAHTRNALADLRKKLQEQSGDREMSKFQGKLYTVRINGKAFRVPWSATRAALLQSGLKVKVMNNVDLMDNEERRNVLDSMEYYGQDLEKVKGYKSRQTQSVRIPTSALRQLGPQKRKRDRSDEADKSDVGDSDVANIRNITFSKKTKTTGQRKSKV